MLSLVGHFIAFGIDDAEHEMTGILAVWKERVLIAVAFPEIAGERTERHAIHFGIARSIRALDVHREFSAGRLVRERQVGIEILLRTQIDFEAVRLSEFDEHREEQKLKHL